MRSVSESKLAAWFQRAFEAAMDWRLFPYFRLTITSVQQSGNAFLVQGKRTGETSPDGNTYLCYVSGYIPSVGDDVYVKWVGKNAGVLDGPVAGVGNVHMARYWAQAQTVSSGSKVQLVNKSYDVNGDFVPATYEFLCSMDGDYEVRARLAVQTTTDLKAGIRVNGTEVVMGDEAASSGTAGQWAGSVVTDIIPCKKGDRIALYCDYIAVASAAVAAFSAETYMTVRLLAGGTSGASGSATVSGAVTSVRAGSGISVSPTTGDVIVQNTQPVPNGGTVGQVLTKHSGSDQDLVWGAAGLSDPTSAVGDLIARLQAGLGRIAIGGAGQVLTVKNLGNYALAVMNLGPYSYYRLNEASGTTMADSTAAHRNGTYSAAGVTYHVAPATGDGDFAVTYNGTSGYSSIANPLPSGDWSAAFFFKGSAAAPATSGDGNYNSQYPLLSTFNAMWSGSAAQNGAALISINSSGQLQISEFYWNSNLDNGLNGLHGSGALNDNAWHHCVVTFQGSSGMFTVYIDGAAVALTGTNGWRPGLMNFGLPGTMDFAANPGPSGPVCFTPYSLDEVSIFDAVLTAAQAANLNSQSPGVGDDVPSWQDAPTGIPAGGGADQVLHGNSTWAGVDEDDLAFTDITTGDVSATKHGLAPKLTNTGTKFLRDDGTYATPAAGATTLAADTDVAIASPADGDLLQYVASASKWENKPLSLATGAPIVGQMTGAAQNPGSSFSAAKLTLGTSVTANGITCDTTNSRITATKAGWYAAFGFAESGAAGNDISLAIYKNGSSVGGFTQDTSTNFFPSATAYALVYLNVGDYLEVWAAYHGTSANLTGIRLDVVSQGAVGQLFATNYRFTAYRSAAWTPANGTNQVPYDTVDAGDDPSGSFTTGASAHFTAPATGPYSFGARQSANNANPTREFLSILVNGTEVARGNDLSSSATSWNGIMVDVPYLWLNAGDTVAVQLYMAAGVATEGGKVSAWFRGVYLGSAASQADNAWTAPVLQNSWVNFGGTPPYASCGYRKMADGSVRLRGTIKNGTATAGTLLFTLPDGYRPGASGHMLFTVANSQVCVVEVHTDGTVLLGGTGATNGSLGLDGISFLAEQ